MRGNNRKSIASIGELPQLTTMNVIDGQAGLVRYSSLIFYSLTIDNILNIVVLLILAGVSISMLTGEEGIIKQAQEAKKQQEEAEEKEKTDLNTTEEKINQIVGENQIEKVEPENPEDWGYIVENETITITEYKGNDTEIIIPNYINDVPVKKLEKEDVRGKCSTILKQDGDEVKLGGSSDWFNGNESTTKVKISEGIEVIGRNAFAGSYALKEIQLPESLKSIGNTAFYQSILKEITIPSNVITMGGNVFSGSADIIIRVPFKEGNQPSGWDSNWNYTYIQEPLKIEYQQ